jgi:hypothetical protein
MLKKSIVVLLLLVTPFAQARATIFCPIMNGAVVEQCRCPGHADHTKRIERDIPEGVCCEVQIEVSDKDFAGIATDLPAVKRAGNDVPDSAAVVTPAVIVPSAFIVALPRRSTDRLNFPPPRLYLRTARLRL